MTLLASFYFNVANREQALCQLVGKAVKRKLATGIVTDSEMASQVISRLLWEVPPTGFIPHCLASDVLAPDTLALIDHRINALLPREVVFNWTAHMLPTDLGIGRIVEIVPHDDMALRQLARERLAHYKRAGYQVEFTDMATLGKV
ncbi:DNA polymerase III subunit chi [Chitinimonas arctica]|uniref:DNA polymerase III subunit chi n=1 Tax=Chitinimonas arctica TaxID=2594795 RepID=A0A516SDH5_9NEIS|nr:DNA polymerase III subunit chi [Chitinimonas arctica]QDQ26201.1 DNA polymerase III subunit chi [Chitinimonas arctica]